MSATEIPPIEAISAITDPGEVDREEQTRVDRMVIQIANFFAWAFPLLIVCIVSQIFLRLSGYNQAWLDDLQWWVYGAAVLAGFGYAITTNSHVRVDILYDNYSSEKRAKIDAFGLGWLLLPFIVIMSDILIHYAVQSWQAWEGSSSPNGLHNLYILKSLLPLLFFMAGFAAWSRVYRAIAVFGVPSLFRQLLWTLPATLMLVERVVHYAGYWVIRISDPDIPWRRVSREPFFEYTTYISVAILLAMLVWSWMRAKNQSA